MRKSIVLLILLGSLVLGTKGYSDTPLSKASNIDLMLLLHKHNGDYAATQTVRNEVDKRKLLSVQEYLRASRNHIDPSDSMLRTFVPDSTKPVLVGVTIYALLAQAGLPTYIQIFNGNGKKASLGLYYYRSLPFITEYRQAAFVSGNRVVSSALALRKNDSTRWTKSGRHPNRAWFPGLSAEQLLTRPSNVLNCRSNPRCLELLKKYYK